MLSARVQHARVVRSLLRGAASDRVISRRAAIMSLAACLAPWVSEAQQAARVARIGYLSAVSASTGQATAQFKAFHQGLSDHGWIVGQNVTVDYRWADSRYDRLPGLAAELARLDLAVIFANSAPAALAAKRVSSTIPIVFGILGDPVAAGLVASLARTGGNLTGVTGLAPDLSGKRLELLKELVPRLSRVAFLVNPSNPATAAAVGAAVRAAKTLNIELRVLEIDSPEKLQAVFATVTRTGVQALLVLSDPVLTSQRPQILQFVETNRLPAMYAENEWVLPGGLMSYSPTLADIHYRAAGYVDKILKGTKPADLPIERLITKIELTINLKTATAQGLTIPESLLVRATRVIQ